MAGDHSISDVNAGSSEPVIRNIGLADIKEALRLGCDDFKAAPTHMILLVIIYPIVGFMAARFAFGLDVLPLLFPLIAGFALVGPLAAVGLYEISKRRENGQVIDWAHAFDFLRSPSVLSIALLGGVQMLIYFVWLVAAMSIYQSTFGTKIPTSVLGFANDVMTTPEGWRLIIVGSGVGGIFALLVLAISAVSFPMLLDKDVSAMTAVKTSVQAMIKNPVTMVLWGVIVAVALLIGTIPLFVGLAVIMPILGHATWHLYRRIVDF